MTFCAGCSAPLPPNKGPGRARKWCSERCRKTTLYARVCIDCGATCNVDGRVTRPAQRCMKCASEAAQSVEARRARSVSRPAWTDAQCFAAIRRAATDGVCTKTAYAAAYVLGKSPCPATLVFRFGSWRNAVHAAGCVTSREHRPTAYANRTPDAGLLMAIQDCAADLGRWPGARQYDRWSANGRAPTRSTLIQRFGSWLKALEAAMDDFADESVAA